MTELTVPSFIDPAELDQVDLGALRAAYQQRENQLNRQLVHTTLAHLLRDCDGLEALTVTCGQGLRLTVNKGIVPVWSEHAPKSSKAHYQNTLKSLLSRMVDAKIFETYASLFNPIEGPSFPRVKLHDYRQEERMTLAKAMWHDYLRAALSAETNAHLDALSLVTQMSATPGAAGSNVGRSRL